MRVKCSGSLSCLAGSDTFTSTFQSDADGCHLGKLTLSPDGHVDVDGTTASWSADANQVVICMSCIPQLGCKWE